MTTQQDYLDSIQMSILEISQQPQAEEKLRLLDELADSLSRHQGKLPGHLYVPETQP